MKKFYLLFFLLAFLNLTAQTTETFETESVGSPSFTDNGQVFNITTQSTTGTFDIYNSSPNTYGFNGTSNDSRFIDNSGAGAAGPQPNAPIQFTISSVGAVPFILKRMYLYLGISNGSLVGVSGSCTITGKLGGSEVFTAFTNSPFANNGNGFTLIDMTNYGGANNSNAIIDSFVVTTTGNIAYAALDAMTWQSVTGPTITTSATSLTGFASCSGSPSDSQSFTVTGSNLTTSINLSAVTGYEYSTTSGGTYTSTLTLPSTGGTVHVRLASSATGSPSGSITLTSQNAGDKTVSLGGTVTATPVIVRTGESVPE